MAVAFMFATDIFADNVNLPVVELFGRNYYVYKAKKGDSLFGIARMFKWDDRKLQEFNPSAVSPLQKGMKIYYPANVETNVNRPQKPAVQLPEVGEVRHTVKRGETVYALSNMYGVPVDQIYKLNPDSRNGIKAGESLLIRSADSNLVSHKNDKPVYYTVKQGDTLYGISKEYGVSVASIMKSNPGIGESNFKAGANIKIPARGSGISKTTKIFDESTIDSVEIHKVSKNETWSSIASENGVSEEILKNANPDVKSLKNKDYIAVPRVETVHVEREVAERDPREISDSGITEIYQDVHKLAEDEDTFTVRVAVVTEDDPSKKDLDYIRGFLAGIETQKNNGYKIVFKVVDGSASSEAVITELDEFKPTMVFVTSDSSIPSYICEYASVSQTPVVNAFDVKSVEYTNNPYIIQLLTPSALFNENVANYIYDHYSGRTIIFAGDPDQNDQLAEALRNLWDPSKIRSASVDDLVPERFAEDGKYIIYGYPVKKEEVTKLLDNVIRVREERPMADINVLGRPNLVLYEDALERSFHKADIMIPSRFYIDKESSQYKEFMRSYKSLFNRNPLKSLPLYAGVGYDNSTYFISELAKARGDVNKINASVSTVQSDYDLIRISNWGGFLNPPVYIVEFTPYDTIDKKVVYYAD